MKKPLFEIRTSPIQGFGAFATRRIRKGTRIIEYKGERISAKEGDARYEDDSEGPILLFKVDKRTAVDAGVNGNEARYINHSCDPNCETVIDKRRIYIEAIRTIQPGEELTYDYNLTREDEDDEKVEAEYSCHCGAANCRGNMLEPRPERKQRRRKAKRRSKRKRE